MEKNKRTTVGHTLQYYEPVGDLMDFNRTFTAVISHDVPPENKTNRNLTGHRTRYLRLHSGGNGVVKFEKLLVFPWKEIIAGIPEG